LKYGRIVAVNSSTSYGITDTFKCDFPIISGDSGGPIFYPSGPAGGTKATLIGISTGTNTTHSFYVKLHNIFSGLGLKSVKIN
jgi:S1-C subfamily serine protease